MTEQLKEAEKETKEADTDAKKKAGKAEAEKETMQKTMEEEQRRANTWREHGENMQIAMDSTLAAMRAITDAIRQ